jgi:hypothetical protein
MLGGQYFSWHFFQYSPYNQLIPWGFRWVEFFLYYVLDFLRYKEFNWLCYVGKSISKLQIDIELKQIKVLI